MDVTFLEAHVPLRKRFDQLGKHAYPNAFEFTSHHFKIDNLKDFTFVLQTQAAAGRCLLKGNTTRKLENESRKGSTDRDAPTTLICFDADGLHSVSDADSFMEAMGLADYSYCLQWSSSAFLERDGEVNTDFNAHVFVMLDEPVSPHRLKLYLKRLNFDAFKANLALTASNMALKWGLDITTCQNDKLLYISPPDVHPPYSDTIEEERITFVQKEHDTIPAQVLDLDSDKLDPEKLKAEERTIINQLRADKGLEAKDTRNFKLKGTNVEYLPGPDEAKITGIKQDRGFVYFNLNGGDSWAYFHPEESFEYIFNFKGEPTYRTKELLPAYYAERAEEAVNEATGGRIPVGFRGLQDGLFYNGFYDPKTDNLELHVARRERDVIVFLAQYFIETDKLPTYRIKHDPKDVGPRVDFENATVNFYTVPEMEKNCTPCSDSTPTIDKILTHVVGEQNVPYLLNWLAFVYQRKEKTGVAVMLHGAQGTGKGLLFNNILRPMFGFRNAVQVRTANFEDNYNGFLEHCTLMNIDEVDVPGTRQERSIMANWKNYITEPFVTIRKMFTNAYSIENRLNLILSSNRPDPMPIEATDRRFFVADYQDTPIQISNEEIELIAKELPAFVYHILMFPYDERMAKTAPMTEAKKRMQELSETSIDQVCHALIKGKAEILYDFCGEEDEATDMEQKLRIQQYNKIVKEIICHNKTKFTRGELRTLFECTVGNVPTEPAKFTKYLRHHGLEPKLVRIDGKPVRGGIEVEWTDDPEWFTQARSDYGEPNERERQKNGEVRREDNRLH
jgi:hypothetical protein